MKTINLALGLLAIMRKSTHLSVETEVHHHAEARPSLLPKLWGADDEPFELFNREQPVEVCVTNYE